MDADAKRSRKHGRLLIGDEITVGLETYDVVRLNNAAARMQGIRPKAEQAAREILALLGQS